MKFVPWKKKPVTKNAVGGRILFNIWFHTTVVLFMEECSKLQNRKIFRSRASDWSITLVLASDWPLTCLQLLSPHTRPASHSWSPSQSPSPATQGAASEQHRPWSTSRPAHLNAEKYQIKSQFMPLKLSSPVPNPKPPRPSPNPVKSSQNQFQRDWGWH